MKCVVRMRLSAAEALPIERGLDLLEACAIPIPPRVKEIFQIEGRLGIKEAVLRKTWDGYGPETLGPLKVLFSSGLTTLSQRDSEREEALQKSATHQLKVKALQSALELCNQMSSFLGEEVDSASDPLRSLVSKLKQKVGESRSNTEVSQRAVKASSDLMTLSALMSASNQGCCGRKIVKGIGERCSGCPL